MAVRRLEVMSSDKSPQPHASKRQEPKIDAVMHVMTRFEQERHEFTV